MFFFSSTEIPFISTVSFTFCIRRQFYRLVNQVLWKAYTYIIIIVYNFNDSYENQIQWLLFDTCDNTICACSFRSIVFFVQLQFYWNKPKHLLWYFVFRYLSVNCLSCDWNNYIRHTNVYICIQRQCDLLRYFGIGEV